MLHLFWNEFFYTPQGNFAILWQLTESCSWNYYKKLKWNAMDPLWLLLLNFLFAMNIANHNSVWTFSGWKIRLPLLPSLECCKWLAIYLRFYYAHLQIFINEGSLSGNVPNDNESPLSQLAHKMKWRHDDQNLKQEDNGNHDGQVGLIEHWWAVQEFIFHNTGHGAFCWNQLE